MLIGLTGRKEAGKDTTFQRIEALYSDIWEVEKLSFAGMIYESAAASLGVTVEELHRWKSNPQIKICVIAGNSYLAKPITVRRFLQYYGSEAHRHIFGEDFWSDHVAQQIEDHAGKLAVVTDIRTPAEAQLVRDAGGKIVEVLGRDFRLDVHETEQPLHPHLIDFVVDNSKDDQGYQNLDRNVHLMMDWLKANLKGELV